MIPLINASGFHRSEEEGYTLLCNDVGLASSLKKATYPAWATRFTFWRDCEGPFACVIQDKRTQDLLLVRDHLGVAPLYYGHKAGQLIVGNALPDLLAHLPATPPLCNNEVSNLFSLFPLYSDDTLYTGIQRVEPGHMIRITPEGRITKQAFWTLNPEGEMLHYAHEEEYVEHFTALMRQAIHSATTGFEQVAAEFSAGMDSTAVYTACRAQGIEPDLFMHAAIAGSAEEQRYHDDLEQAIINQLKPQALYRIREEGFDPLTLCQTYSQWFAGSPPYVFDVFAHNLHRAVTHQKHRLLLSGFGGDQGVSGHASLRFILPELIARQGLRQTRRLVTRQTPTSFLSTLKQDVKLLSHASPWLYHLTHRLQRLRQVMSAWMAKENPPHPHPYDGVYFKTLREAECALLQGAFSHEIRMRIEASSIVSKQLGFEYRYPLLYPKLLEFYIALPIDQKRRNGQGRFLMRRYLEKQLPNAGFQHYQKKEGLYIYPATLAHFTKQADQGCYDSLFKTLSYPGHQKSTSLKLHRLSLLRAYMLHAYLGHQKPLVS